MERSGHGIPVVDLPVGKKPRNDASAFRVSDQVENGMEINGQQIVLQTKENHESRDVVNNVESVVKPSFRDMVVGSIENRQRDNFSADLDVDLCEGDVKIGMEGTIPENDYLNVLSGDSWIVYGSYLTVQLWPRNFDTFDDHLNSILVWVRLHVLPYRIDGRYQVVEYEGLSTICYQYGKYGHTKEFCNDGSDLASTTFTKIANESITSEEPYGPWMQVARRKYQTIAGKNYTVSSTIEDQGVGRGYRFETLASVE
ncbi:hypothetical protein F3Y22_tig00110893pilonHSYRG00063 [Hibiscus syriacus]|uniref:Uncharacterized protein n=1 Tax=Hibiscus syriacus TaxID=106335 RepID=A0A6A2ZF32_HIBSY|nr:hypothetical protein F3Y22_tig00110893pilonHSYRG00063 [Hibiscus syriacus]